MLTILSVFLTPFIALFPSVEKPAEEVAVAGDEKEESSTHT